MVFHLVVVDRKAQTLMTDNSRKFDHRSFLMARNFVKKLKVRGTRRRKVLVLVRNMMDKTEQRSRRGKIGRDKKEMELQL